MVVYQTDWLVFYAASPFSGNQLSRPLVRVHEGMTLWANARMLMLNSSLRFPVLVLLGVAFMLS